MADTSISQCLGINQLWTLNKNEVSIGEQVIQLFPPTKLGWHESMFIEAHGPSEAIAGQPTWLN